MSQSTDLHHCCLFLSPFFFVSFFAQYIWVCVFDPLIQKMCFLTTNLFLSNVKWKKKKRKTTQALKYYVLWYRDYLVMYRCTYIILNVNCYVQCKCVLYYSFLWYKAPCSGNCIAISKLFCFDFFFF